MMTRRAAAEMPNRAYIMFTDCAPILVLTSTSAINEPSLLRVLSDRGIVKFIAYEIPADEVRRQYGVPFEVVASDLEHSTQLRVLDFDGSRIFDTFSLTALGPAIHHEN